MKLHLSFRMMVGSLLALLIAALWFSIAYFIAMDTGDTHALKFLDFTLYTVILAYAVFFLGHWARRSSALMATLPYFVLFFCWIAWILRADDILDIYNTFSSSFFWDKFTWNAIVPGVIAVAPPIGVFGAEYLRENKLWRSWFFDSKKKLGFGGPSSFDRKKINIFGNIFSPQGKTCAHPILGRAIWWDDPRTTMVGDQDEGHLVSVGCNGSGKSVTSLWPTMLTYKGSMIVLDPKGEHVKQTAYRRSSKRWAKKHGIKGKASKHLSKGEVYILDPFGETGMPSMKYNVLSEINPESLRIREELAPIVDGCVIPEAANNKFWEEMAKYVIEGVIVHVLTFYPKENHNLPFVYDLITGVDEFGIAQKDEFEKVLIEMQMNDAAGGITQQAAMRLLEASDNERGAILTSVGRSLKWVSDPAMRKQLIGESDLKFADIGAKEKQGIIHSLYIVLPDGLMTIGQQIRWLRTLTGVAITKLRNRAHKPKINTLFVLDEFARLGGDIEAVSQGVGILRSYKVKLWVLLQSLSQIKNDIPKRWESYMSNSTKEFFGVSDQFTADYVSKGLGKRIVKRTERKKNSFKRRVVSEDLRDVLSPAEVMVYLSKNKNRKIVFPLDGMPLRLERIAYKALRKYNPLGLFGLWGHRES